MLKERSSGRLTVRIVLMLAIAGLALNPLIANAQVQPPVGLGTADSFAVLAGQGVTNTGPTVVDGDLGTSPDPPVTGFPPGTVNGAIHEADAVALQAQNDLTTAYNDAASRTPVSTIPTELGGQTLTPGVYDSESGTFEIVAGGTLTLDAEGDPDGVFIFQMASTLVTFDSSDVNLIGSASPCNVFWQVGSSATLGTNSNFTGTILALTSIEVQTDAVVEGRVLARNASVTLDDADIDASACIAAPSPSPSQVTPVPSGGVQTGGGSTDGVQDVGLLVLGGALLAASAGTFAIRRRAMRHE